MLNPKLQKYQTPATKPTIKVNPANFADTTFQNYAEKIVDDYSYIIKTAVVPQLPGLDDLKIRELRVLACVDFFASPISPVHIAALLRYDPATVTRAIKRLVDAGKVERIINRFDTRSVHLKLTEAGRNLVKAYADRIRLVFANYENELVHGLTEDEKITFLNVMVKISKRAEILREICTARNS